MYKKKITLVILSILYVYKLLLPDYMSIIFGITYTILAKYKK